jgi:hypothetical protein
MPDGSVQSSSDVMTCLGALEKSGTDDRVIRSIVMSGLKRADAAGLISSRAAIRVLCNLRNAMHAGRDMRAVVIACQNAIDGLPTAVIQPSLSSLEACLRNAIPDHASMVMSALDLAGSEAKIFVEPSTSGFDTVELIDGFTFNVAVDAQSLRNGRWSASDCRCIVIDGTIERVSEIDAILSRCNRDQVPLAIFARGYSNDVISTIRVNNARRTLDVLPVTIEFDLETVNVLNDIAVAVGCDVISSLKGEIISTTRFDDLKRVENVSYAPRVLTIKADRTARVDAHVANLADKRSDEVLPALRGILDLRIRSLSSSSVIVRVHGAGSVGSKRMHDIDVGLKLVRAMVRHGCVSASSIKSLDPQGVVLDGVIDGDLMPAISLGSAIHFAKSVLCDVASAGGLLQDAFRS